jgi:peptidoglycan/LPS O-acetylase OafA/YrhL
LQKFHLGYRPALDGLRGVAILSVIAAHSNPASGWAGDIGVDIFFVLSGFLITSLIIQEWDQFHSISLRRFYARRALRLLPALVVLIAAFLIWHGVMNLSVAGRTASDGLIALFYMTNWALALGFRQPAHVFAHTWTLSIEEQFYLWWPIVLIFLLRHCRSRASLLRWMVLGMFLLFVERVLIVAGVPRGANNWLYYATEARADTLLVGCAAAIVLCSNLISWNRRTGSVLKSLAWLIAVPGLILMSVCARASLDFFAIGMHLTTGLLAAMVLMEVVFSERGALTWILSRRWLVYIGKVSYGLYLWHYPVFSEVQTRKWPLQYEIIVEITLTLCATALSFYAIERPALRLKSRFSRVDHEKPRH